MAAYFIKLEVDLNTRTENRNIIIDFDKFEKVCSKSINNKIKEKIRDNCRIIDITKL